MLVMITQNPIRMIIFAHIFVPVINSACPISSIAGRIHILYQEEIEREMCNWCIFSAIIFFYCIKIRAVAFNYH
uniref:Uncharacterized protein n=1 Tax=Panstrongylus lignarius TaxID=156445 RepID=A0A224Y0H6_9HEMI